MAKSPAVAANEPRFKKVYSEVVRPALVKEFGYNNCSTTVKNLYDRGSLVERSISTVVHALGEASLLVVVLLFLFLGSVRAALEKTRNAGVPVEIEVRTREELDEALQNGATHLLLDNLTPPEAREWIAYIRSVKQGVTIELSGGINLQSARAYAETGADFLSSGSITHSAVAVDINFGLTME